MNSKDITNLSEGQQDMTAYANSILLAIIVQSVFVLLVRGLAVYNFKSNKNLYAEGLPCYMHILKLLMYISYLTLISFAYEHSTSLDKGSIHCANLVDPPSGSKISVKDRADFSTYK